ncbi:MAG: Uma2 family endonuclease [Bacteroidia bacterium]
MNVVAKHERYTVEEFLSYLDTLEGRAEYYEGEIFNMAGGSSEHGLIIANIVGELRDAMRKRPCRVYPPDVNLAIDAANTVVQPDVHVVCGEPIISNQSPKLNTNATLVVEVLSPSTYSFDRGGKFQRYRKVPNLQEYMIVEQSSYHVEVLRRQESGIWAFSSYDGLEDTVELTSLGITLPMTMIYEKVELAAG